MTGLRWWSISCSSRACRWTSRRRAATLGAARVRSCPRCGSPVNAFPAGQVGLRTVMFPMDGPR